MRATTAPGSLFGANCAASEESVSPCPTDTVAVCSGTGAAETPPFRRPNPVTTRQLATASAASHGHRTGTRRGVAHG
jgi:hypothetical protein